MESLAESPLLQPFTHMNPQDWRAIQGHALSGSSGFFLAATLFAATAGKTKKLCIQHAAKARGPLQSLANAIDGELGSLLGASVESESKDESGKGEKEVAGRSKGKKGRQVKTSNANSSPSSSLKNILSDPTYVSEVPAENSEYAASPVGPYTSPVDEEDENDEDSSMDTGDEDDGGEDVSNNSGTKGNKKNKKGSKNVMGIVAPPSQPEELSFLATLKSFANVIHTSRLEPDHEFGRSVGSEMFKLQRRVARIL